MNTDIEQYRAGFEAWFDGEYPKNEEGRRLKYVHTGVMDLMMAAYAQGKREASTEQQKDEASAKPFGWITPEYDRIILASWYGPGIVPQVEGMLPVYLGRPDEAKDAARYRAIKQLMESAKGSASIEVNQHLAYYDTCEPGDEVKLQWYPDTPIGFYTIEGFTLDDVADQAIAHTKAQEGK